MHHVWNEWIDFQFRCCFFRKYLQERNSLARKVRKVFVLNAPSIFVCNNLWCILSAKLCNIVCIGGKMLLYYAVSFWIFCAVLYIMTWPFSMSTYVITVGAISPAPFFLSVSVTYSKMLLSTYLTKAFLHLLTLRRQNQQFFMNSHLFK